MIPGAVMAAEMDEQPGRLAALLSRTEEIAGQVRQVPPDSQAGTVLIARGSSDDAATTGRYLLELATGRPVASASPSLYTMYGARTDFTGFLVIGVSQSGRTPEIVRSMQAARRAGGRTVAVTNDSSSPLAQAADVTVCLDAGPEQAVPATKTVTAELAVFALIAQAAGNVGFGPQVRDRLPGQVAAVLDDPAPAEEVAGWLAGRTRLVTVARGPLYGAAAEAALKVEETTSLFATGYSAADLRHGPIAVAFTRLPVLAFAHPGPAAADLADLTADLQDRGADVRLAGPISGSAMPWPTEAPEVAAPMLAVVRAQQLALARHAGQERGVGGWGWLLGDESSGYWIIKQAVREILRRHDDGAPPGPLTRNLLDAAGCPDERALLHRFYDDPRPDVWAAHVPAVLGTDDPFSGEILDRAAHALAGLAASCSRRLNGPSDLPVVLAGGLLTGYLALADRTRDQARRLLPDAPLQTLDRLPVAGAVALAHAAATKR